MGCRCRADTLCSSEHPANGRFNSSAGSPMTTTAMPEALPYISSRLSEESPWCASTTCSGTAKRSPSIEHCAAISEVLRVSAWSSQSGDRVLDLLCRRGEISAVRERGCIGEGELPHVVRGDDVNVCVRHFVAGDDQADSFAVERPLLRLSDQMADREEVRREVVGGIDPVIDLLDRHDERVAAREWVDRHEHDAAIVAVDEAGWDLAVDDAGEDRRHGGVTRCIRRTR